MGVQAIISKYFPSVLRKTKMFYCARWPRTIEHFGLSQYRGKYFDILPALPLNNCILLTFLRDLNVEDVASDSLVIKRQNMIFCSLIFQENIITDKWHTNRVSYVQVKVHQINKSGIVFIIKDVQSFLIFWRTVWCVLHIRLSSYILYFS